MILAHGRVKALLAEDKSTGFIEADACDVGASSATRKPGA